VVLKPSGKFSGFDKQVHAFLGEMHDKDKAWFDANEDRFNQLCRKPSAKFSKVIGRELERLAPEHYSIGGENGICEYGTRPEYAKPDKLPYMPLLHFEFRPDYRWSNSRLHFVISAGGIGFGGGISQFDAQGQRNRFRDAVMSERILDELIEALEVAKRSGCYLENLNFRYIPKIYETNERNEKLIKLKGLIVRSRTEADYEYLYSDQCVEKVVERFRSLLPLQKWILENVCRSVAA